MDDGGGVISPKTVDVQSDREGKRLMSSDDQKKAPFLSPVLVEDGKPSLVVEGVDDAYQNRMSSLGSMGVPLLPGSRIIATAIRRRRQVGSGRNFVRSQRRLQQKKKEELESRIKSDMKAKSQLDRNITKAGLIEDAKSTTPPPSSPSTSTFVEKSSSSSPSTLKRKIREIIAASPKSPTPTTTPERKSKADGGRSDRWLRSKSSHGEMEVSFDLDLLTRRRRTPKEMKKLRERLGSSDSDSKSCDVQTPKPVSPVPPSPVVMDVETPAPPKESTYNEISVPQEFNQEALELAAEVKNEIEEDDEPLVNACSTNAWPKHFPFSLVVKPLPVSGEGLTPSKILKYSATFDTDSKIRNRIRELKYEGLWSATRLPKVYELPRVKDHWDFVLEEMTWLAEDFISERRWKLFAAQQIAESAKKFHIQKKQKNKKQQSSPIKQEMEFGIDMESCSIEDLLTYSKKGGSPDQTWMGKREGQESEAEMPFFIFKPPTLPTDGSIELHMDFTLGYLYNYITMCESELPPVYVPKKAINANCDPNNCETTLHQLPVPRFLFAEATPWMLELRKRLLAQRASRPLAPWKAGTLPLSLVKSSSVPLQPQRITPSFQNWLVEEDATLLDTVRNGFQLQRSQFPILPAHTMNWALMADKRKLVGMSHKSPKQCLKRYENVVKLQADLNLTTNLSSQSPDPIPQGTGNVEFDTMLRAKLKAMKAIREKKQRLVPPPPGKGLKLNPNRKKVPIEDLLRSKFSVEYHMPLEVKAIEFTRKKEVKLETQRQQVTTPAKPVSRSPEIKLEFSSLAVTLEPPSTAAVVVSKLPTPAAINIDVSSSSKIYTSTNKVEIKPCELVAQKTEDKTSATLSPTSLSVPNDAAEFLPPSDPVAPESLPSADPVAEESLPSADPVAEESLPSADPVAALPHTNETTEAKPSKISVKGNPAVTAKPVAHPITLPVVLAQPAAMSGQNVIRPIHFRLAGSNTPIVLLQAPLALSSAGSTRQTVSHLRFPPGFLEQLRLRYGSATVQICFRPPSTTTTTGAASQVIPPPRPVLAAADALSLPIPTRAEDVQVPQLPLTSELVRAIPNSSGKTATAIFNAPRHPVPIAVNPIQQRPLATQTRQVRIAHIIPRAARPMQIATAVVPVNTASSTAPFVRPPAKNTKVVICETPAGVQHFTQPIVRVARTQPRHQSAGTVYTYPKSSGRMRVLVQRLPTTVASSHVVQRISTTLSSSSQVFQQITLPSTASQATRGQFGLGPRPAPAIISQGRRTTFRPQPRLVLVHHDQPEGPRGLNPTSATNRGAQIAADNEGGPANENLTQKKAATEE